MMPAIFAADKNLPAEEFEKFLRFLVSFLFRYTVIGGRNTNALEPASSIVAQAIVSGRVTTAMAAAEILNDLYVTDETFKSDFENFRLAEGQQNRKIAKYILCAIEDQSSGKTCSFDTDESTIEHIAPQAGGACKKRGDDLLASIANLTLLEEGLNRRAGRLPFAEKIAEYERSGYEMARDLASAQGAKWDEQSIRNRSHALAKKASSIWRSPFSPAS